MSKLLEAFARRYATRVTTNGVVKLTHDNDPLLKEAFKELGWKDQHNHDDVEEEVAVAPRAPERAVVPHRKTR